MGVIIVEMENEGEKIVRESVWLRGENERENGGATILGNFGISLIFGKNVGEGRGGRGEGGLMEITHLPPSPLAHVFHGNFFFFFFFFNFNV